MDELTILQSILDSVPYELIFVDTGHIVRYMNRKALEIHGEENGVGRLIGKSLLDCHNANSRERIKNGLELFKAGAGDIYVGLAGGNGDRLYMNPVRNRDGELIGYFERHEKNLHI